jgi:hypothetical protein
MGPDQGDPAPPIRSGRSEKWAIVDKVDKWQKKWQRSGGTISLINNEKLD